MKTKIDVVIVFSVLLLAFSCNENADIDPHYAIPAPANLNIANLEARKATVNWDYKDQGATGFTLELFTSSAFEATGLVKQVAPDITERSVSFDSLASLTTYYVRMQASNGDPLYTSAYATLSFESAEIESIFNPVSRNDLTATSVLLTWNSPKTGTVTHVILTEDGGSPMSPVTLSASEIAAGSAKIENLKQATTYKAVIYDHDEDKGEVTFTTLDPNVAITINSGPVIYENLQDAVDAANPGDVIHVGEAKYDFSDETITIDGKSLTIMALEGAENRPEITLKNFDLKGNISDFHVEGLKIISTSKANTSTNTDYNKHLFELTYVSGNIDVMIENCDLSGAESGLCFTQTVGASNAPEPVPGTGNFSLTVDHCLLHDFGNAGGDFIDFRSGTISKILIRNSTFRNGCRSFLRIDNTMTLSEESTVRLENCTINSFSDGGQFVRARTANTNVVVQQCLVTNKITGKSNQIEEGCSLTFIDCNIFGTNSADIHSGAPDGGWTELDPQYADPDHGDLTVGNAELRAAGIGDPRWY